MHKNKKTLKRVLVLALCTAMLAMETPAAFATTIDEINTAAEVEPEVVEAEAVTESEDEAITESENEIEPQEESEDAPETIGVMPDDFIVSDISEVKPQEDAASAWKSRSAEESIDSERFTGAELPTSYDSRNVGGTSFVTPARDQNYTNLCWAFSMSSLAESAAIKAGLRDSSTNFASPSHMAYFMYHHVTDPLGGTEGAGTTQSSTNNYLGNTAMATLQMIGWQGPGNETDVPFSGSAPTTVNDSYAYTDNVHMTDAYWAAATDSDSIKSLIQEHGSVTVNMYLSSSYLNSNQAYFYNGSGGVTHAITLVGWDDNYSRDNFRQATPLNGEALADGAWIAKDSWAIHSNRDNGYLWLSYQDSAFSGISPYTANKAIAIEVEGADNYDHNYQYDGSNGTANSLGSSDGIYAANIFEAKGNDGGAEQLQAISFATPSVLGNYSVQVYTGLEEGTADPTSGDEAFRIPQTGSFTYAGVHTVKLDTPVNVEEGSRFAVVVRLTDGITAGVVKTNIMTDKTYNSGSWAQHTANLVTGRSFYSVTGTDWTDSVTGNSAILRVKAFTNDIEDPGITYPIEEEMVADLPDMEYTGLQLQPDPVIHYKNVRLVKGTDYYVTYGANKSAGKNVGMVTIRGMGRYVTKTAIVKRFTITRRNINSEGVTLTGYDNLIYDGTDQTPVIVKDGSSTLPVGAYKISYLNNKKAGTATATIQGVNNYCGIRKVSFQIAKRSLSDNKITYGEIKDQAYIGKAICMEPVIKDGNRFNTMLIPDLDVRVVYKNNIMPGVSEIEITGKGNYSGTHTITFHILPRDIARLSMATIKPQTYQGGTPIRPEVVIRDNAKDLTDNIDFTTIYADNTGVGTATVTIAGKEGTIYAGSTRTATFEITKVNLASGVTIENFGDRTYTTKKDYEQDKMTLSLPNGTVLRKGSDYTVKYSNNQRIGTATMTITAVGEGYTGTITKTFRIMDGSTGKCLNDYTDSKLVISGFAYNREYMLDRYYITGLLLHEKITPVTPEPILTYAGKQLVKDKDYKLTYKNNDKNGVATVYITAVEGSGYYGRREEHFTIVGIPMFVLGEVEEGFHLTDPSNRIYDGTKRTLTIRVRRTFFVKEWGREKGIVLKEGTHYKVRYEDNINAGTATYVIEGIGQYSGTSKEHHFEVLPRDLSTLAVPNQKTVHAVYNGEAQKPNYHIRMNGDTYLREGSDYELTFSDNVNVGTAKAVFSALNTNGNFEGSKTIKFTIEPRNLSTLKLDRDITGIEDQIYDGTEKKPVPVVTCAGNPIPESDYTISYGKNVINPGKNYVQIKARSVQNGGSGNFTGSKKIYYNILGKELDVVTAYNGGEQSYTGRDIKPVLDTIETTEGETLTRGEDYRIGTYKNNRACGEAYIQIKGIRHYKGRIARVYFNIVPCEVTADNVKISDIKPKALGSKAYVKPKFTVWVNKRQLKAGKDYTVTYSNNTKKGTGNIRIAFIGNYSGSTAVQFKII